ncbi:MAG: DUF3703 domain-containing protein [Gammaproteobacteria bacterium]|nr:DUF3703 domain-containing protein [Gammaproteobacteria bacterium]
MSMGESLRKVFNKEMSVAKRYFSQGQFEKSFQHLERAHVLGQRYVVPHTHCHIWMLFVGVRTRNLKEIVGQLIRIPGGIVASAIGKVPIGNTGGTNIKLTTTLPIPDEFRKVLGDNEQK